MATLCIRKPQSRRARRRKLTTLLSIVAVTMLMGHMWQPSLVNADPSDTLEDGFAFSTAATGLIETGNGDLQISSDRESLDEDDFTEDPGSGTAGFIVVSDGLVLIGNDDLGAVALLQEGDAFFVPTDLELELQAIDDDARILRISLAAPSNGDDELDDVDVQISGDPDADDDALRSVSFRTGVVLEGTTATMGAEDEQVPLVLAIEGDIEIVDGADIDEGDVEEVDGNQVESEDDAAFVGFLAVGPARTFDGSDSEPEPEPTDTPTDTSTGGGDQSPDPPIDNGPADPPVDEPEPTATETPEPTPTSTPEPEPEPIIDTDSDGLSDSDEVALGTDPNNHDSDMDGLPDGREVNALGSNPLDTDTDSDGLTDGLEVDHSCGINQPDSDGDGLGDAFEANSGFSECSLADTDGDGDDDLAEFSIGTDPRDPLCFSGPGSVCQT